jgi:TonB family protein
VAACSDTAGPSLSPDPDGSAASSPSALQRATVDVPPTLVGGLAAVQESIDYPETAQEAGIEGRVIVQFVVDEKGTVRGPSIAHGAHEILNEAALQAVTSQSFAPGKKEGAPVPVQMSLPVTFRLDDASSPASGAAPDPASGGRLFEKAGIQIVRVLINEDGHLLLDGERVGGSDLPEAVRRHITKDAARAVLLHADGAPADRIAAAEARLRSLELQNVYVRTAE